MVKEQDGFEVEGFLSDFLLKGGIFGMVFFVFLFMFIFDKGDVSFS